MLKIFNEFLRSFKRDKQACIAKDKIIIGDHISEDGLKQLENNYAKINMEMVVHQGIPLEEFRFKEWVSKDEAHAKICLNVDETNAKICV